MRDPHDKNFQLALECFKNSEVEKAEEYCTQILQKNPHHGNTLHLMGIITWRRGDLKKGAELVQKAIDHHKEKAPIFSCNLALIHIELGSIEHAAKIYKKAADLFYEKEEFEEALNALLQGAFLLRDHQKWAEAKSFYQQILQLNPFHLDACNDYALILRAENNLEGAAAYFNKILKNDPSYVAAYLNLGATFQMQKKSKEAATLYEKCLEMEPLCLEAHINLSTIYREEGLLDKAFTHGLKALEIAPEHPGILNNLGILHGFQGEFSQAIAYFRKALLLAPDYQEAQKNLETALEEEASSSHETPS